MHFPAQLLLLLQWDNKTSGTIPSYLAWDVLFFGRAKHVFTLTGPKTKLGGSHARFQKWDERKSGDFPAWLLKVKQVCSAVAVSCSQCAAEQLLSAGLQQWAHPALTTYSGFFPLGQRLDVSLTHSHTLWIQKHAAASQFSVDKMPVKLEWAN